MDRKVGIMVIVLVLGVMCAGESVILSAQNSQGSATSQTQVPNDASKGKASPQTPQDPVNQQTQTPNDTIGENPSTGIRRFGIHFDPIIRLDIFLSVIIGFFGVVITLLIFIFGSKTRSKTPPGPTAEDVNKPENADKIEEYIKKIDRTPNPSPIEKAIADAYILQRGGKIAAAIEKWRSIANVAEGNDNRLASRGLISVGYLYLIRGTAEQALSALNKAIDLRPDYVAAYNNRGAAKNLLGKHLDAIADYDKVIQLKPDYAEAYSNRGVTESLLEKYQDAIADYDKALQLKPDYAEAYDGRGTAKHLFGRSQEAIADYNKAIRLKPDYAESYLHRGNTNRTLDKYEDAFADYNKVIDLQPDYAEVYNHRGSLQVMLGHYRKAIIDYTKAIQLIKSGETKLDNSQENSISLIVKNSGFGEAEIYYNRGVAKLELGEFTEALADYNMAIQLKPDYAEAYHNRGVVKIQLNQPNEALVDLNEAIQLKPDYTEAYHNRGVVKIQLNQPNDALADFDEAIRIQPDYTEAYNSRGGVKLLLGETNEAITDFDEAIRINPEFINAYTNRAQAKIILRSIKEAKSDFQTALELAEQQQNTGLKASIAARLQQLNNSTPRTDET